MLHLTQTLIFISYFDKQNLFGHNFTWNTVFTIRIPEQNAFIASCQNFQEKYILPKQICKTKKTLLTMPIRGLARYGHHMVAAALQKM